MPSKQIDYELNKKIGAKLLRVRVRCVEQQYNVADVLKISAASYSKLERGKVDFTVTKLQKLADFFKVNISDFLDESIETPRLCKDVKPPKDYQVVVAENVLLRELIESLKK